MLKCILIYLWIYIGLYYVIEAADADEHVHIKLHMPSGQRKYTHHHTHHHKKRQNPLHYHSSSTSTQHRGAPSLPVPPPPPPPPSHLYHEIPQNYVHHLQSQQQNNIKKLPPHLHESGQLQLEELADVYSSSSDSGTDNEDTDGGGEHMMIPSYLPENFALFPQPTIKTTYETDIIPQNLQGFQHNHHSLHPLHPHNVVELHNEEGDNEITGLGGEDAGGEEVVMLEEEAENYPSHNKPFAQELSSSSKIRQKEQLLQQILQQQEIINAAKFRGNKYKAENDYHSENDMTETMMMYSSEPHIPTATTTTSTFAKGTDAIGGHTGIKALTVDDIWSQLQRQYLNKYVPQAQALNTEDLNQQTTTKKKRTTKRQRNIKSAFSPLSSTSSRQATSSFWPAKTLNYDNNHQHQQKPHYDDNHSSSLPSSFFSSSTSTRNTDLFDDTRALSRPYNNFNGHNIAATAITAFGGNNGASEDDSDDDDDDDDSVSLFNHDSVDDIEDDDNNSGSSSSHDTSFHENVYQRGKKFIGNTGHVAYGNGNTNNPFNYHDLYASYSTPVTATVATKIYPSTYHPKPSKASSTSATSLLYGSISPTLSHESTSYQWHTQQHNNPVSYQSYQLQQQPSYQQQHQQQQPQQQHHYRQHHPQSSALRLPKATITQMPSTLSSSTSSLSPTMSNDFTSADKSTVQPSRYKKRKNRIKTKRNRIVVI